MSALEKAEAQRLRLERCRERFGRMEGVRERLIEEKAGLILSLERDRAYLDQKDAILDVLNRAQDNLTRNSRALFEELLTTLLREVMPGTQDRVVIETGVKNNRRWLEVVIETGEGERLRRESVLRDKGGSVQNLLSIGLRFIVLARSRERRLLVLDEPDCWLREDYVPALARAMGELARRIGVQVLYVSHHKPALLAPFGRVLHLRCARGQIEVEASDAPADSAFVGWEGEAGVEDWLEGVGLTHIRLRNVRQHASTRLALSPGLNIITGDNDIGKSTIVHALRAARDNAGFAGLIGQQDDSAEVEIGLEEGRTLCYRYRRKGARKSTYTLLEADGSEIAASDSGTAVPAWVSDHLAMPPAPDIDLHIGEQAAPLFMIGAETSTYQRAELLSLGREGDHAARLVRAHTERVRQCRQEVARAERALRGVKLQLATLRGIDERITALRALAERMQASAAARERAAAIRQSGQAIAANAARLGALASLPQGPIAPEAGLDAAARERPGRLYATMARLEVLTARAKAIRALPGPLAERKLDTGRPRAIARLGRDLGRLSARIEALAGVESLTLPAARAARDTALMRSLVERSAAIERQVAESARASEEGARRLAAIDDERAALMTEAGGHCPLCLRPQTDAGHHHHHGGRIA